MDAQQQIFSLMAAAEDQQKAIGAALEALAAERAALAKERAAVAQAAASVAGVANDVRKAAAEAVPSIQKAAGEAVGVSVRQSLAGVSETATAALEQASQPIIGRLTGVIRSLGEAESQLSNAVSSFGWRWALVAGGAAAGCVASVLIAAWLSVWWQRHQVETLIEQKAQLQAEVAELQTNAQDWTKRAGRAKLDKCGEQSRLCVRIDKDAGTFGNDADYAILKGY